MKDDMKKLLSIFSIILISCSSSTGKSEFQMQLEKAWVKLEASEFDNAETILANILETVNGYNNSEINNAYGWLYNLKASGYKNDPNYIKSFDYFVSSSENDSKAGLVIVGLLIEEYTVSAANALLFIDQKNYKHKYLSDKVNFSKLMINGAWSSFFNKDWVNVKLFLDSFEPTVNHSNETDSLLTYLTN